MNAVHKLSFVLALAFAAPLRADYLPDPAAAETALWASPSVMQARGDLDAQALNSQGLQRGRDEWTVGGDIAQRRIQTSPRDNQFEWGLVLSRPVRLPARAAADRALADALTAYAEASLGEALHESGRQLLGLWFAWLNEQSQVRLWQSQLALAEEQLRNVNARIRLGEAPRAERVNAEAALAQIRLQQQQVNTREQQTRSRLRSQFPVLPVVVVGELPVPELPAGTPEAYVNDVLEHNHELFRARRYAEVLQATARQFAKRRSVDPHMGVFYKNDAGGNEHVLGLNVALTLPGAARQTDQQAAERLADTALDAANLLEQRLRQEAQMDFESAVAQVANWQQADRAAQAQTEAARLSALAYKLGEGNLDQVLLNRRLALESQLLTQQVQMEALSAHARLKLDSHRLWPLDVHTDKHHAHH